MGLYPIAKIHLCISHPLKSVSSCCVHYLLNGSASEPSDSSQMMELSLSRPFLHTSVIGLPGGPLEISKTHLESAPTWKTAAS